VHPADAARRFSRRAGRGDGRRRGAGRQRYSERRARGRRCLQRPARAGRRRARLRRRDRVARCRPRPARRAERRGAARRRGAVRRPQPRCRLPGAVCAVARHLPADDAGPPSPVRIAPRQSVDSQSGGPSGADRHPRREMIETPTVSVLLTVYNRERYVGASIESVLAQTCRDFELMVCDDHSAEGTGAIVDRYARDDRRIRICVNERNLGQFRNRGHAASLARGRYLKYHDSDDLMYPHCLETMLRALEAEPRAAFALSGSQYWPGGPCPMLLTPKLAYEREFLGSGLFHLGPAAALFRTDVFRELGGFPLNGIASDYLFWIEACAKVSVLLVSADLFYYRIHHRQELSDPTARADDAKAA